MPAFAEEIEAADHEGIRIQNLVTPVRIISSNGRLQGLECIRNELGEPDDSGRRRPVPIEGTEHVIELDTLIVAIGEDSGVDVITPSKLSGIETTSRRTVRVEAATMQTNQSGVFAAGDVVRGPNTVVEAIADGKQAAVMIERYLKKEPLLQPVAPRRPSVYVEPVVEEDALNAKRAETPRAAADWRKRNFAEVEVTMSQSEARKESLRCLRCDLEFSDRRDDKTEPSEVGRQSA